MSPLSAGAAPPVSALSGPSGAVDSPPGSGNPPRLPLLTLGALGVVYGDIGTSPLYAFRETLAAAAPAGISEATVTGCVSLLIWTIMAVVTLKYVVFLLHADNDGEGGALALYARVRRAAGSPPGLTLLAIAGAAFFFGDAVLTPAVSVLSAIEGVAVIEPAMQDLVLPIAAGVLAALFVLQKGGTGRVASLFGPVMALWFLVLGGTGLLHLPDAPRILAALSPLPGLEVMAAHPGIALAILGGVFLCVTGAEALYADLGHFGRRPIRLAWFALVLPALVLNYLGQGALVLGDPPAASNPFFLMAGPGLLPALVALAAAATVIASQAVITGAYSLGRQALQLGLLPRMTILHTSGRHAGQIYIPMLNWSMMAVTVWIMDEFGSSSALASAYGISVLGSMLATTLLAGMYLQHVRRLPRGASAALILPVLLVEGAFAAANLAKVGDGGWVPLAIALAIMAVMTAWLRGTRLTTAKAARTAVDLDAFLARLPESSAARVDGLAVFLTAAGHDVPPALLHNLKHNKVLHRRNVILTVEVRNVPKVDEADRARLEDLPGDFQRLRLVFGFMETPNVSKALAQARQAGLRFDVMTTSFFLGRRRFVPGAGRGLPRLADRLYIALTRIAADPIDYFALPRDRVVEIGARIAL